jgi:hypothetical protein
VLVPLHPGNALDRSLTLRPVEALQDLRLRLDRPTLKEHPGVKGQIRLTTVRATPAILRTPEGAGT